MRTTLTLDDDVAALLERIQEHRKVSLKVVVNEALRQGLTRMLAPTPLRPRYETPSVDLGGCLIGSLDDIADVLAVAEGEDFK